MDFEQKRTTETKIKIMKTNHREMFSNARKGTSNALITRFTSVAVVGARLLLLYATAATLGPWTSGAITVTNTADSGPGTLRAALASAANGDTIDATGVSGSILLTSGELLVTNSVTILGPGPANLAVNGNAASRVFHISGTVVTIAGLTITNGRADSGGGGIFNDHSILTVSACTLTGNSATNSRGGG